MAMSREHLSGCFPPVTLLCIPGRWVGGFCALLLGDRRDCDATEAAFGCGSKPNLLKDIKLGLLAGLYFPPGAAEGRGQRGCSWGGTGGTGGDAREKNVMVCVTKLGAEPKGSWPRSRWLSPSMAQKPLKGCAASSVDIPGQIREDQ